jgi:hypothetical protein
MSQTEITIHQKQLIAYTKGGPRISVRVVSEVIAIKETPSATIDVLRPAKKRRFSYATLGVIAGLAFIVGAAAMWQTGAIRALTPEAEEVESTTPPGKVPFAAENRAMVPMSSLPNEALYSMTLEQIEYYLEEGYKTPETRAKEEQERILALRKEKLTAYLESKGSPLVAVVDTLVDLKHWRLVLAISNSESSLGKRCHSNNCSGIGVMPGHPLWQEYETKADWAKALDRLLERRYKGWTLQEMNGVYNQPGSANWLLASTKVLNDLREIE